METILILVGAVILAVVVLGLINMSVQRASLTDAVHRLPDFAGTEVLVRSTYAIACNVAASKFAVAWGAPESPRSKTISADSLISVEIECLGETAKIKRSGFSTISTSTGHKEVNLCVKFRDSELPVVRFPLYVRIGENNLGEQTAISEARKWESSILAVAHSVKTLSYPVNPSLQTLPDSTPRPTNNSLAQEIANLRQLMVEGTLSEAEFEQAKAKTLSR